MFEDFGRWNSQQAHHLFTFNRIHNCNTLVLVIKGLSYLRCPLNSFDDTISKLSLLFFILEYSYEYADHGWLHLNTSVHIIYSTILFLFIFIQVNAKENCSLELPFYLGTCCAWIRDKGSVLVIHSLAKIHPISYPHSS